MNTAFKLLKWHNRPGVRFIKVAPNASSHRVGRLLSGSQIHSTIMLRFAPVPFCSGACFSIKSSWRNVLPPYWNDHLPLPSVEQRSPQNQCNILVSVVFRPFLHMEDHPNSISWILRLCRNNIYIIFPNLQFYHWQKPLLNPRVKRFQTSIDDTCIDET